MKEFKRIAAGGVLLSVLFFSCKKQFEEPLVPDSLQQTSNLGATTCKPTVFGTYRTANGAWTTIMQKWYANNRVQNLKVHFSGRSENVGLFYAEPILNIDWGNVTYEGDQVKVWDVGKNLLVFRATLDASGKPVASYLYNYMGAANEWMFIDTSYYYYSGDRLTSIFQIFQKRYLGASVFDGWEQYRFIYGASGQFYNYQERVAIGTAEFRYGSTPINGMVFDYVLTTSFRMLEYLDLIRLPINYAVYGMNLWRTNPRNGVQFMFYTQSFYNVTITDGLVQFYLIPYDYPGYLGYYTGWECATSSSTATTQSRKEVIMDLDQFKKSYPDNQKK